jgi:Cu/Ag efflux protein CusF
MRLLSSSLFLTSLLAFPLFSMGDEHHDHQKSAVIAEQTIHASGTVKSIAENHESLRIFHDPISALKWPAMNMEFTVKDHDLIHSLEVGDRVKFEFISSESGNMIVKIGK